MTAARPNRLLVTGGRGRLASLVADYFRAPTHEVALYSRSAGTGFHRLEDLNRSASLAGVDTLLHLAWSTLPATSEQSPNTEEKHDLPLLENILSAIALQPEPTRPHFIFFSSGGTVYGNASSRPNVETDQRQPVGSYGRAKLAAEELILQATARHGLSSVILRISNPYGYPVPSGRLQGVIPHAIRAAVENRPLTLWGDGHARKDFLYYTDFLSVLHEVIDRRLTGIFNVSAGESHSVLEIIALVERHTGRKIHTTTTPARRWDVQDSRLHNGKLIAATGWQPQVSLDEGIRRSTVGYLDH